MIILHSATNLVHKRENSLTNTITQTRSTTLNSIELNLAKRVLMFTPTYLGGFDHSTFGQIESHVAGEVKALRQINPSRNVEKRASTSPQMLNPVNCFSERFCVHCPTVTDASEVGNRNVLSPVRHRHYPSASYQIRNSASERRQGK